MNIIEVFPWNENFETGIVQIDEQHKRLVSLLNILASHLTAQADASLLDSILNELTEYASYHFQTEETIWQQFLGNQDDWALGHQQEHSDFIVEVLKLKQEEHNNNKTLNQVIEEALSFLIHWLAFHILDCDKRMAKTVLNMMHLGLDKEQAKQQVDLQMGGATKLLVETILYMYDSLSTRTLQLMREVNERQRAEAKLRLAANVFDNTLDAICITDAQFTIIDSNPSFQKIIDLPDTEIFNQNLCLLKTGLLTQKQLNDFWDRLNDHGHWSGLVHNRHKDGEIEAEWLTLSLVRNEQGEISHYVAIFSNVSHLIRQQQSLEKIAHHDVLTGLPNRLLLQDRLKLAMAHAERTQTLLAICYIDLDGFKPVNDRLGHLADDYLLQEIAKRFIKIIRASDTAARIGGDEFILLLSDLKAADDSFILLERINKDISQLVHIGDDSVKVTASIGVTLFPLDNSDVDNLLHHADTAMYQAKRLGKARYYLYKASA